jgi:hypothetical protein
MRALTLEIEIRRFIGEEQFSLAVILSQTMLELLVEREVRSLADGLQDRIVHDGAQAERDDAVASLEAVRAITWRLHQLVLTHTGRQPDLEEDERIRREDEGLEPLED